MGRLADGLYDFADAVRDGMRERETELRTAGSSVRHRHRREASTQPAEHGNAARRDAVRPPAGQRIIERRAAVGAPGTDPDQSQARTVPGLSLSRAAQTRANHAVNIEG